MIQKGLKPLLSGDSVIVRSLSDIISTLDRDGMLEGLPFMQEMARYCGKRFAVYKRIERTCEESDKGMRRIKNVVFLDNLRCDGSEHGGCQKGCRIFWKEAWLTRSKQNAILRSEHNQMDKAMENLPGKLPNDLYVCQSTELVRATTPFSKLDLMSFLRDAKSKTYSIPKLIRLISYATYLRFRYHVSRKAYRFLQGRQVQTPTESLGLQPGELVKVKDREEIRKTLDAQGKNRGLQFTADMVRNCGRTYRVLKRLEKMIHEPTRKLINLKDTVILENSVCQGCHIIRGGCPRENFNFWREIWLERIPEKGK